MDKNTTDKGWAAMRGLLDREMPEKRRRRFGWWWFGLLLLPIVGYGSWQWLGSHHSPTPKQETLPAQPFASTESTIDPSSIKIVEKQAAFSSNTAPAISNDIATDVVKTRKRNKNADIHYAPTYLDDSMIREEAPQANFAALAETENKPHLAIGYVQSTELESVVSENKTSISPQAIPISELAKPIKKTSHKHWAFGATSAVSTEQFKSVNGFSTGLTIDWKFAKKWGLRTGAMYNIHTPQEKYRPVASVASADYHSNVYGYVIVVDVSTGQEVTNVPGNNFYDDSLAGKVFIPVNRLQRLEVPLTLFWQAARPLKIIGGLSLTRTLSAKADKQNYSGDYILKLADRTAEDGASKLSSSELDNWSADAMIGIGINLGKSFELGLSAKMPINKFPGIAKNNQAGTNANGAFEVLSLSSTRKQNGPVFSLYGSLFF
ncbi:MAG: hypothetical protein H7246_22290 [Phycisphaerae bacterium]|nr:hypothetical protein [Saprospiraceae bacterium]